MILYAQILIPIPMFFRSWVAGVTATEVMLAHVITQFGVMVVQVSLVLLFMIYVFEVPAKGPIIWIIALTILQGICGMAFGLVISALCDNEQVINECNTN